MNAALRGVAPLQASVLVTHLNDPRVKRAVASALAQPGVLEVVVADGGSRMEMLADLAASFERDRRFRVLHVPGSVAESRNEALPRLRGDVVAFLDADQVAPSGWLDALGSPIEAGRADFTGGPTRPMAPPKSAAERFVNREEERLYARVRQDMALLPMGNSAWRRDLLGRIGGFDPRLAFGGEDYDVNLRALGSGARGEFVEQAWVHHDQSHLDSFGKVLQRRRKYYFGAATAYLKNRGSASRVGRAAARLRIRHWIDLCDLWMKPVALWRAHRYYRRAFRK